MSMMQPDRLIYVGDRIQKSLQEAMFNNQYCARNWIALHFERHDVGKNVRVTTIFVKAEIKAPVASTRSLYPQDKFLIIGVEINLAEMPPITLQQTSTILNKPDGQDEFSYHGINESEFGVLIENICRDVANYCPLGLSEKI